MVESMAGDFSRREGALRAELEQRDATLTKASGDIRDMSGSLARLKRDVAALRTALGRWAGHGRRLLPSSFVCLARRGVRMSKPRGLHPPLPVLARSIVTRLPSFRRCMTY